MVGPLAVKIRDPLRARQVAAELNLLARVNTRRGRARICRA